MSLCMPHDHGVITFGPLATVVPQKTCKTLCGARRSMGRVTDDASAVSCMDCLHEMANSANNTYTCAHDIRMDAVWQYRFSEHCPCIAHTGAR